MKRTRNGALEDACLALCQDVQLDSATDLPGPNPTKRACTCVQGGAMTDTEVMEFLAHLSHELGSSFQPPTGGLNGSLWSCMAELNRLLDGKLATISGGDNLQCFHSFIRTTRENAWLRFASCKGLHVEDAAALARGEVPPCGPVPEWMQLVSFMLGPALRPFPLASLIEYTVQLPSSLLSWAARWGLNDSRGVMLLHVQAILPNSDTTSEQVRSFLLPIWAN